MTGVEDKYNSQGSKFFYGYHLNRCSAVCSVIFLPLPAAPSPRRFLLHTYSAIRIHNPDPAWLAPSGAETTAVADATHLPLPGHPDSDSSGHRHQKILDYHIHSYLIFCEKPLLAFSHISTAILITPSNLSSNTR